MFQLPDNPPWNLLLRAVRWILAFLLTGIVTFPAEGAELAAARSIFAFTGTGLYFNTAWPNGGTWVRLWPCAGDGVFMQLPTEGGGFITARFDADDGSPLGNWYTADGKVVYFRPDNGFYYVWNPEGVPDYTIQIPGAVRWIEAIFDPMRNGFFAPDGVTEITWDAENRWNGVGGEPDWQPAAFTLPTTLPATAMIRVALKPPASPDGSSIAGSVHFPNGDAVTFNLNCATMEGGFSGGDMAVVQQDIDVEIIQKTGDIYTTVKMYHYAWTEADGPGAGTWTENVAMSGNWEAIGASPDFSLFDGHEFFITNRGGEYVAATFLVAEV